MKLGWGAGNLCVKLTDRGHVTSTILQNIAVGGAAARVTIAILSLEQGLKTPKLKLWM